MSSPSFQRPFGAAGRPHAFGPVPPPYGGEPEPRGPVEIHVGGHDNLVRSSILLCLMGVVMVQVAVAIATSGLLRAVLFVGAPVLAAVYLAVMAGYVRHDRAVLSIDRAGLSCRDRRGDTVWSVSWAELSGVVVTTAYHIDRMTRYYRMRMMLIPRRCAGVDAASALADRQPRLARWRGRHGARPGDFGVPLAKYAELPRLDVALRTFATDVYRGIVREGRFVLGLFD